MIGFNEEFVMNAFQLQGKRILVVDDELETLRFLELLFTRAGAKIHTARNGPEAFEKLSSYRPDLVILDIMMPEMSGLEVCHRIRDISDIPIIMLTALAQDD